MTEPIVFSAVLRSALVWLGSPTAVILLSLALFAWTLATIAARATRKEDR